MDRQMDIIPTISGDQTDRQINPRLTGASPAFPNLPDDIVIVSALRTPIGKAGRGSFKDTFPDDLLATVFKAVIDDVKVAPEDIGDICIGNVSHPRDAATVRMAQFFCGIPESVPVYTTNRFCSSGLQAVLNIAGSIRNGACTIGLAGGFESMTLIKENTDDYNPRMFEVEKARDCLIPMGITSENVAKRFGVSRLKQDQFAFESQKKASEAQRKGKFDDEIVPVTTTIKDKEGNTHTITVRKDDGIRPNTTFEGLSKLRPAFQENGTTTAGNSSQVSDGAAAVLVTKRSEAVRRGWPVLGVLRSCAVRGCPPDIMGIGPAVAIPSALQKAGLSVNDIDVFEINEAFASQALYCVEKLGIDRDRVNPNGGAIALGHPLGCTGSRQVATLLHELKRRGNKSLGVVSMCVGTGMGVAAVFEYPGGYNKFRSSL